MTDEQIKLNAEVYANTLRIGGLGNSPKLIAMVSFEEGAHSRDVEIENLQNQIEELSEQLKMNTENIQKLRNSWNSADEEVKPLNKKIIFAKDTLRKANEFIANPPSQWISVEKQLPRIGQPCFLANFDKRRCGYGKFCADDGMLTRWERIEGGSTMIYYLHEVTHWMPIPELKKGDEND